MMEHRHRRAVSMWAFVGLISAISLPNGKALAQEPGTVIAADKRLQARSYVFQETGEQLPYALFVPSNYNAARQWPLIVGLHGWGRPYDWLMGYDGIVDLPSVMVSSW